MFRTAKEIQKDIDNLNKQHQEDVKKEQDSRESLNQLKKELKFTKEKLAENTWYKKNPLVKYYKRTECINDFYNVAYYINIDDKLPNKYDWNIGKILNHESWLNAEEVEFTYTVHGRTKIVNYYTSNQINVGQFKRLKNNKVGNHGLWTPITEEKFLEEKKWAAEFITSNLK